MLTSESFLDIILQSYSHVRIKSRIVLFFSKKMLFSEYNYFISKGIYLSSEYEGWKVLSTRNLILFSKIFYF